MAPPNRIEPVRQVQRRLLRPAAAAGLLALALAACAPLSTPYVEPVLPVAPAYRSAAASASDSAPLPALPASWWTVFGDPALDALQQRALAHNPSLLASAHRLAEAKALLGLAAANQRPSVNLGAAAEHLRTSGQTPQARALGGRSISGDLLSVRAGFAYELDAWDRVAQVVAAADARQQVAASDLAGVRLLLTTQLAQTYWQWRGTRAERDVLERAVASRREARELVAARLAKGLTSELDVHRAEAELANISADLHELRRQEQGLENSLAVLVGAPATEPLALPPAGPLPAAPTVPAGVPADLLRQRPDLIASAWALRATYADIRVAEAAFYPSIQLTGNFGFASYSLRNLADNGARQFSIGPLALNLPLFDGGRNQAGLAQAKARHEQALAEHRSRLLNALREVEDVLSNREHRLRMAEENALAEQATRRAWTIAQARYERGLSGYLDVIDVQRTSLAAERLAVKTRSQLLQDSVTLVRALGGGWGPGAPTVGAVSDRQGARHE